jgi:Family of unknown function (DUF6445)
MEYDLTVNERFSVQTRHIGRERQPVVIVDDFLRDPDAMVRYAANETRFIPSPTLYPGIVAPVPEAYVDALVRVLVPVIGEAFGVKADTAYLADCFFAIATFPPEQLHFRQRLPHVDDYHPGLIAVLHYLCAGTQGGTALYRHRATGYESLTEEQNQHLQSLIAQDIARNPIPAQYVNAGNRLFEQTACFEAKFNRLLIYRGQVLHSMLIDSNTKLNPDPRIGRLTANTSLRFELA